MIGAIIAGVSAAAGIGLQLLGGSKEEAAAKKQAKISKQAADKQNKIIKNKIIPALKEQRKLEKAASQESALAEALRAKQMELDATRMQRAVVRNAVLARSESISNIANQGGGDINSSAFFGSLSQITSEQNRQLGGIFQNLSIGRGIFQHNKAMAQYITDSNQLRNKVNIQQSKMGTISNTAQAQVQAAGVNNGQMLSNIGSTLVSSAGTISQLGTSAIFGKGAATPATQPGSTFENGYFYDQPV
jgi:hypothetical protein